MIHKHSLRIFVLVAIVGCGGQPSVKTSSPERDSRSESSASPSPRSFDELKDLFLRNNRDGDIDAAMSVFYSEGASERIRQFYRSSIPTAEGLTIRTARVEELSGDTQIDIPHTLTPEKVLMLEFEREGQQGPVALSRFFYMGRNGNEFYLTLPKQ
jgi:hypothetical protein